MATAEQLKALIRSHNSGDNEHFRAIAMQIAAVLARNGKARLAQELRELLDKAQRKQAPVDSPRAVPISRPAGELAGLVSASYPNIRLTDMVLSDAIRAQLDSVVQQYHQRDTLRSHGLQPKRKLLFIGPPGCGKTMSASAIAGETGLPLLFVQLHSLITKFMGETAAKLHLVFDAMVQTRAIYLFDEFDAIGAERGARNDVGEIRRVLSSFLQFLERDESESIIIAATNFVGMLDKALFRRFDGIVRYDLPSPSMVRNLVESRLAAFDLAEVKWRTITATAHRLSQAEVVRACEDAARRAVLSGIRNIATDSLKKSLDDRHHRPKRRVSKDRRAQ